MMKRKYEESTTTLIELQQEMNLDKSDYRERDKSENGNNIIPSTK